MEKNNLNDEQLMKMFQNGDEQAYNQLVTKYKDRILNYIINFTGDYDSAQDLAQDTFLKVYIKKDSYKEIAKFSTWLYTIAGNLAKTELRKIKRRKTYSVSALSKDDREFVLQMPEKDILDETEQYGQSDFMQSALLELEDDFRNIIILREIQGTSYEIISKILKLPLGTVKSRLNRGKLKLRDILIKFGVKN
mgnify:CR=1 FL=1